MHTSTKTILKPRLDFKQSITWHIKHNHMFKNNSLNKYLTNNIRSLTIKNKLKKKLNLLYKLVYNN